MNHIELKTARKLLNLSIEDAAENIGGVSQRSWKYWENGERPIPQDVERNINFLLDRRKEVIKTVQQKMLNDKADLKHIAVIYYPTPDHCESVLDWRFSQSIATTLAHDYGARMVIFNETEYTLWLINNGMTDTPDKRSQWASEWSLRND